jgi:hypothetical protein
LLPEVPNGAQKELQQPVQPLHTMPSTAQPVETVAQVPGLVAVAPEHTPPQHWLSALQMSPGCVQYDTCEGLAQWPARHAPLQHSPLPAQVLPAVLHVVLSGVHVPLPHLPEQQLSVAPQGWLSEMQAPAEHVPPAQLNPQQSPLAVQVEPVARHCGASHTLLAHEPEQHSPLDAQLAPPAVQPPSVEGITTSPSGAPRSAVAPTVDLWQPVAATNPM